VRTVRVGDILYVAGTGPMADVNGCRGKVGQDVTVEEAREAARSVAIKVIGTLKDTLGDLDRVKQVVKTLGMVNAVPDFTDHVRVINGYSDLLVEVFGEEKGKGVRSAVGMGSLPGNLSVEVESVFWVE